MEGRGDGGGSSRGGSSEEVDEHGVQGYLSVIESPAMNSEKTGLLTAMLRLETRPHVLKVFSETARWHGQGEKGYFHGAPEDWNLVASALQSEESLSVLVAQRLSKAREGGKALRREDARATALQNALEVLPQDLHRKIVPATRTFLLRRTSKTMRAAVAKLDTVVVSRSGVKFRNGAGLKDKLNWLNAWCRMTVLDLNNCDLQEGGGQAIADVMRVNTTLTNLILVRNELGEGGAQAIAAALRENRTLTNLILHGNELGEGGGQAIADVLRVNTTLTNLNLGYNELGEGGGQAIAAALRVNTTLTELDLGVNFVGEGGGQAIADVLRVNTTLTNLNL